MCRCPRREEAHGLKARGDVGSSSALKASLPTKSGGRGSPAAGARPGRGKGAPEPRGRAAPDRRREGPGPAEAARAAPRGGAAAGWAVRGRRSCSSPGRRGARPPDPRSRARGGCCARRRSRPAGPPSAPAPAAAEGRRARRGPGGAKGGRLPASCQPQLPAPGRAPEPLAADAPTASAAAGLPPLVAGGLRSPGPAASTGSRRRFPGAARLGLLPSGLAPPWRTFPHDPSLPPP